MIKVLIGHRVKRGADIQPFLRQLRENSIQYPGFIGAENLRDYPEGSIVILASTWDTIENWRAWEKSGIRMELYRKIEELLVEEPRVSIYTVVPTHW